MANSDGRVVIKIEDNAIKVEQNLGKLQDRFASLANDTSKYEKILAKVEGTSKANLPVYDKIRQKLAEQQKASKQAYEELKKLANVQRSGLGFNQLSGLTQNITDRLRNLALQGRANTAEFENLANVVKSSNEKLKNAEDAVQKAIGTSGFDNQNRGMQSLISTGKSLIAGYVGIQGAIKALNFSMESVDAFRIQERAIAGLNIALRNAGVYSDEYSLHLQRLASEIQGYSNYGDEAILKAQGVAQAFIGQTKITDELTKAVVDFATANEMDLDSAFRLVGKSIGSSTNALSRYGVELEKGMSDQQKMAAVTKQLGERYKGQAAKMADANIQLKNSIGDMKEAFGSVLDGYVTRWQKGMNIMVQATTRFINKARMMRTEISDLTISELKERYNKNALKIADYESRPNRGYNIPATKEEARLKAENTLIIEQIKYNKKLAESQKNIKPIKITDEEYTAPVQSIGGGGGGGSSRASSRARSEAVAAKSDFEQLQSKIQETEKTLRNLASAKVVDIQAVQNAKNELAEMQSTLQSINNSTITSPMQLANTKVQQLQSYLADRAFSGQWGAAEDAMKNQMIALQNQIKNANTQVTNMVGVSWENIANSIKSNLSSALLTPLKEGESAFERLGNLAFSIIQSIGQELANALLIEPVVNKVTQALKNMGNSSQPIQQVSQSLLNTGTAAVQTATATTAMATGQAAVSTTLATTSTAIAGAAAGYKAAAVSAQQLAASITQAAISQAAYSAALVPIAGAALAPIAATATGAAIAAGNIMATGSALLSKLSAFENGGVFQNGNVIPFAKGGVVSKPATFPMANGSTGLMGEAGAEAVMPLKRMSNGRLGVEAQTGNGNNQVVNIYNQSGAQVETQRHDDNTMDVFIRKVNKALSNERTSSGFRAAYAREDRIGVQAV